MIKHYWRFIKSFKRRQHEQEKEEEKEDDVTVQMCIRDRVMSVRPEGFFSYYGVAELDTYDRRFYPTRGI